MRIIALALLLFCAQDPTPLKAGFAEIDISPAPGTRKIGWNNKNVGASGLRYGQPLRVGGVRALLQNGGGMCGDWYKVFQQMAHCQGVFVHRRAG